MASAFSGMRQRLANLPPRMMKLLGNRPNAQAIAVLPTNPRFIFHRKYPCLLGALANAKTLPDVKEIRDQAEAFRHYARSAALGLEAQNHAAEAKLRAERKAGELLRDLGLHGGDRKTRRHQDSLKLADMGISQNQSSRWQRPSAISANIFEEYVISSQQQKSKITAEGLLRAARRTDRQTAKPPKPKASYRRKSPNAELTATSSERCAGDKQPSHGSLHGDVISDLKSNFELLTQIMEPLLGKANPTLRAAELQHARRLIREIKRVVCELSQVAPGGVE